MKSKTTLRTIAVVMIMTLMTLCLTGCGGSSSASPAQEAADGVLSALQAGDIDKVTEYASEDILMNGDLAGFRGMAEFTADMLDSLGVHREDVSDEAIASLDKLGETLKTEFIESYTIDEVKEEGDTADVTCTVTFGYDADSIDESAMAGEVSELVQEYAEENQDELTKVLQDEGQDAFIKKLISACMPAICDKISEHIAESEGKTATFVMKVEDQDGKWKVTDAKAA